MDNEEGMETPMNNLTQDHNTLSNGTLSRDDDENNFSTCLFNKLDRVGFLRQVEDLLHYLKNDTPSCDFTWSLFLSALHSYRFDTCLRPYPTGFLKDGLKDPIAMRKVSEAVPDVYELIEKLQDPESCSEDMIDLLHWVLVHQRDPFLKPVIDDEGQPNISELFKYVSEAQITIKPNFIYEVVYSKAHERTWNCRKWRKADSIFAFHGSRLDNFYSITKFGLQQHLSCAETLYGAGIYLSSELMLSLTYSPAGTTWDKSIYGSNYSIVALCEIVNDKKKVRCQDIDNKRRATNIGSIGGSVPDKYYVVLDNDMVRVRYLLAYRNIGNRMMKRNVSHRGSFMYRWAVKHKMLVILISYTFLLILIGFFNGSTWHRYYSSLKRYYNNLF